MNHVNKNKGFTLIELLLAMTFISVLLLAIAMTILQISNIYNRGIIVKDVSQVGRSIVTELQTNVAASVPFSVSQTAGSHYFQQPLASPYGGRLCLGQYSYIWNYGSAIQVGSSSTRNLYTNEALLITATSSPIRLVKVYDTSAAYCTNLALKVDPTTATELLNVGDHSLAIQNFSISTTTSALDTLTGQQLYTITFDVGTNDQNALTNGRSTCKAPGTIGADLSYCVVQNFSIVARAGSVVQ
ncbi:MAG: hypothetical protein JWN26_35 [Candidatus Saccharibacteria bacterium]|nr:hypothetical protein [Candidatus Saccharibacteria bacterium]